MILAFEEDLPVTTKEGRGVHVVSITTRNFFRRQDQKACEPLQEKKCVKKNR